MKSYLAPLAALTLLATETLAQGSFTINSLMLSSANPTGFLGLEELHPDFLLLTFRHAQFRTIQSILPANQPGAQAIQDLGTQNGNSLTWIADLGVGTSAFLNLKDSTGLIAQSGTFTILDGPNKDCIGKNPNASAGSGGGSGGGSPAPNTSASNTSGSKTTSPTTSPSPTTSTGAASALSFNMAAVPAIIGAAVVALA
ncbi:hypothetical protein CVT24_002202 [Panaeolus cyanescens]|uniref:Uncharacterized protein n=1 Tax=Panaeolus cyanescens TaxID=181874 RepID=A0A409YHY2_9AGAR|nr:hypothetical protein CVT24_002202 [Panaeolus cyanescens]